MEKLLLACLIGVALAGCGTSQQSFVPIATVTRTVTVNAAGATVGHSRARRTGRAPTTALAARGVSEQVRLGLANATWTSSATATPGDTIQFRTSLDTKEPATVRLVLARGPQPRLTVTATASGQSSSASVTGTSGSRLTLLNIHYTCAAPPDPSFCPVQSGTSSAAAYSVSASVTALAPLILAATVGPTTVAPLVPPGAAKAASFSVRLVGRSIAPGAAQGSSAHLHVASVVSVTPGGVLALTALIRGRPADGGHPLRLTLAEGPGTSLTATASVSGYPASSVQITSATGAPVKLVTPRYLCYLTSEPTACPAVAAGASGATYTAEFAASASLPPISLVAGVLGG